MSSVIIWTGVTYGYEQDLLRFAFNSACQNTDVFPIPNSQNYIPVIHIQNLSKLGYISLFTKTYYSIWSYLKSFHFCCFVYVLIIYRIIHKVINENKPLLKYNNCIFAVESPMNTLNKIITVSICY